MLSIEEIKLLIEKLEKVKKSDLQHLIDSNLKILKDLEKAVDANNQEQIDRLDKTIDWFKKDLEQKAKLPVDEWLNKQVCQKIYQFAKTNLYNSLEIGPGNATFSAEFRAWRLNYFLDVCPSIEKNVRLAFNRKHGKKYTTFFTTRKHECSNIPQASCNLIFSWDTFVFFTQNHIQHYLHDIKRVLIPGGYVFLQYADCHYDTDLENAKRGYWNYNTKTAMKQMILDEGYEIVEMAQFRPGANYAIFRKPGKQNPVIYKISEIKVE